MKVYVLVENTDHPYGVTPIGVYSSKEKAVEVFKDQIAPFFEPYVKIEEAVKEHVLEFDLE